MAADEVREALRSLALQARWPRGFYYGTVVREGELEAAIDTAFRVLGMDEQIGWSGTKPPPDWPSAEQRASLEREIADLQRPSSTALEPYKSGTSSEDDPPESAA